MSTGTIITLVPVQVTGLDEYELVGTTDGVVALSDGEDSTYVRGALKFDGFFTADMESGISEVPEGARIVAARIRAKLASERDGAWNTAYFRLRLHRSTQPAFHEFNAIATSLTPGWVYFGWRTERPDGGPWQRNDVAALRARAWHRLESDPGFGGDSSTGRTVELRIEVRYNEQPVTEVTGPTGTIDDPHPTAEWTYSDPEGDDQDAAQLRVYAEPAGGWTGDAFGGGTLVYDSGVLSGQVLAHQVGDPLDNGSYRAYARVRQQWAGEGEHWSEWDHGAFTVELDPTSTPTVSATAVPDEAYILVDVVEGSDGEPAEWTSVEVDYGSGWQPLRFAGGLDPTGSVLDHEAPANRLVSYRARAWRAINGVQVPSAWSDTVTAEWVLREGRWVKDPLRPSRNRRFRTRAQSGQVQRRDTVHRGIGDPHAVVISDTPSGTDDSLRLLSIGAAEWERLEELMGSVDVLLWQGPVDHRYVHVTAASYEQAHPDTVGPSADPGIREVSLEVVEVAAPQEGLE